VKKTSLYLDEEQQALLRNMAGREQRPQTEILRDAIALYAKEHKDRRFALARVGRDGTARLPHDGRSIAVLNDEELLSGFGE